MKNLKTFNDLKSLLGCPTKIRWEGPMAGDITRLGCRKQRNKAGTDLEASFLVALTAAQAAGEEHPFVILPRSGPGYYNTEFPGQM